MRLPAAAGMVAVARPMPDAAPVTTTTLCWSSVISALRSSRLTGTRARLAFRSTESSPYSGLADRTNERVNTATERFARFALELETGVVPDGVCEAAALHLLDTLGCGIAA